MKKKLIFISGILAVCFLLFVSVYWLLVWRIPKAEIKSFGITFSKMQAENFGLDWQKAYEAIFDDLGIKHVRIPVYWDEVQPSQPSGVQDGVYNFSSLDIMVEIARLHNADIILVVGRKVPRWPECFEPDWVKNFTEQKKQEALLDFMKRVVERYDNDPVVYAWQVENEPFLRFGVCPEFDVDFFDKELQLVRSITKKPVIVSDSGEFGTWFQAYKRADIFGTTMYRNVYNKVFGQITYPLPPSFFRLKRAVAEMIYGKKPSVVIELQTEAWGPKLVYEVSTGKNYESFDPEEFRKIIEYIKGTGFDTFYFWGEEWWYWLKEKENNPEMWNIAKEAILNTKK